LEDEMDDVENPPPPLCVYCNAPWTDKMLGVWAEADMEDGYYGDYYVRGITVVVDVDCSTCGRLVYRKEITTRNNEWSCDSGSDREE
jgi:hypothetical protein